MELQGCDGIESAHNPEFHSRPLAEFVEPVSPSMRGVDTVLREVAHSEIPVLLLAEQGAGKKAAARRIHELSARRGKTFLVVRCAGVEPRQFLAILSSKGAAGTVFLEEIGDLAGEAQGWLLQALTTVGGSQSENEVRLICGSARDLELETKSGRLREDFYYRVSGLCLRLPPLRHRKEDIALLTEHFLRKYERDFQKTVSGLSAETQQLFQEYGWPGNVAELENAVRAIVALGDERVAMNGLRAMLVRSDQDGNGTRVSLKQAARAASREAEREIILRALTRTRWNRRRAAEDLQISYKALLYKLKQMGCSQYETT